jgi:hypothetical protein
VLGGLLQLAAEPASAVIVTYYTSQRRHTLLLLLLCRLSETFLQDDKLSATAVLVFMLSPASIHHAMAYTEALFTAASWLGLYCLYCRRFSSAAALAFAVSAAITSNGESADVPGPTLCATFSRLLHAAVVLVCCVNLNAVCIHYHTHETFLSTCLVC